MQCNIDARGKRIRFSNGLACVAIAVVLAVLALMHIGPFWPLIVLAIGAGVGGAFQIFEARAGWCVIRAMGFKTRF